MASCAFQVLSQVVVDELVQVPVLIVDMASGEVVHSNRSLNQLLFAAPVCPFADRKFLRDWLANAAAVVVDDLSGEKETLLTFLTTTTKAETLSLRMRFRRITTTAAQSNCPPQVLLCGIGETIPPLDPTGEIGKDTDMEFAGIINKANVPVFGIDKSGLINIWNKKMADISQSPAEDVMGKGFMDEFIMEDNREAVDQVLTNAFNGSDNNNFQFPLINKLGYRVEFLLNASPRYNAQNEIVGMVGFGQDITEHIMKEEESALLIDQANTPIFGVDVNGCVNIWNKKAALVTNYSAEDMMGENLIGTLISEEYVDSVGLVLEKALKGIETSNFEFPLITKFGQQVEILLNSSPRFDEQLEVIGMLGIGQDITERIAQEQEYSRMIDTANVPVFVVDTNGCVNIWNQKAAEITQYSTAEVMGENLVEKFISEEYQDVVRTVLENTISGLETSNVEFPLMAKGNRCVEILLNATPKFDQNGKISGVVGIGQDITDRIAQEQEYSRVIDTANAPIFGVDTNGCVNIWNRKAADITKYSNSDVMGENLVEKFISSEYHDLVNSVFEKAMRGIETANFEFPLITKSGRRVEILLNATPKFDHSGKLSGVVGIGQDITDRIAQEQEYSRLIDTANAPIFGVDTNMCVNIWNKKAAQITYYSTSEVMGENLVETFISPEYRPIVAAVLSRALEGIQTANFEFPLITRPGTRIEILLNATPRNDLNGNIVGVVGIGQDITERIAQEHEYFRLIDTANAPIFGIDTSGSINEWNQKIEEITGYHKSTVLGLNLVDTFIIVDNRVQVQQLLSQALVGVDVGEMELPMMTKRGTFLLLLVNASSKKDIHGNIGGAICVGQDYTARKQMEQAKVNFLASFSHELRTPLNGILGMLELLKEQKLGKIAERHVHMAYVSGSLLLNLINDILDLSKIEAGHLEISAVPFRMEDLMDHSIEIFKFKAKERGLILDFSCEPDVPRNAIGDVVRLRQILLNLLSNAIKFTKTGSITVKCSVVHEDMADFSSDYCKLLFEVIDTGYGMDAEEKSKLFSLFTKLERTRENNPTGSGLGLAICKQLVELMDGQIDVDSELGVGSVFYFTVVVRVVSSDLKKNLTLQNNRFSMDGEFINNDGEKIESVVPKVARILVVEDNEFNWEVVKCFLQSDDHYLRWETNGVDAVEAYKSVHDSLDLVFMDCEMPLMDGYTATQLIREFEESNVLTRIPILGLTAYAMSGDRQKCLDAGMDEFIVKPISKTTLQKEISHWMKVRHFKPDGNRQVSPNKDKVGDVSKKFYRASNHCRSLDINRAVSDLELENPLMITSNAPTCNSQALKIAPTIAESKPLYQNSSSMSTRSTVTHHHRGAPPKSSMWGHDKLFATSAGERTLTSKSDTYATDKGQPEEMSATLPRGYKQNMDNIRTRRQSHSHMSDHVGGSARSNNLKVGTLATSSSSQGYGKSSTLDANSLQKSPHSQPTSGVKNASGKELKPETKNPFDIEIPDGDPINYVVGLAQCGGNDELFTKLLEKYASGCEDSMKRIKQAYETNEVLVLRREVHSLKGSSAYIAAMRVSKAAFRSQVAAEMVLESSSPRNKDILFECLKLLQKEHRILRGYFRRNFLMGQQRPSIANSRHSRFSNKQDQKNACSIS